MTVKSMGVVGAGQVGTTIAQVALMYGKDVVLEDLKQDIVQRARDSIDNSLQRGVDRGNLDQVKKTETMNKLKITTDVADLKDMDLVIEVATENLALKKTIFAELDKVCSPKTILTTNSSSLPITPIAAVTKRPEKCVHFHFWYPAHVMTYMELSRGYLTSDETWEVVKNLAKELGRKPIRIVKDYVGTTDSGLRMEPPDVGMGGLYWDLMLGRTTLQEIEDRPKGRSPEGFEQKLNTMETQDFVGLDTWLGIMEAQFGEYGFGGPPPLLRRMVEAGHLGQKTGIGFYDYSKSPRKAIMGEFSPYLVKFLAKEEEFIT